MLQDVSDLWLIVQLSAARLEEYRHAAAFTPCTFYHSSSQIQLLLPFQTLREVALTLSLPAHPHLGQLHSSLLEALQARIASLFSLHALLTPMKGKLPSGQRMDSLPAGLAR
jgi:hypothetical protein